jgi:predicted PurR-regulated permease PerM
MSAVLSDITSDQINISAYEIETRIVRLMSDSIQKLISISSSLARNIWGFVLSMVFMVFSLFFFYLDGPKLSKIFLNVIPIRKEYIKALVEKFKDITRNLILGYIMVALIQSVLAYIIFVIFSVEGALVFAGLTFICVFIPMLGGALVWLPLGLVRVINGDLVGGIVFTVVSALFISLLDNFIRPIFLQDRIQLHPLIIFFAILGGLYSFGFNGLIIGPIVVILFLTVLDLFLTEHEIDHG